MAGKPKPMSQIKQLIILNRQGKGTKTIARLLGMSKNTVKAYLFKLDKHRDRRHYSRKASKCLVLKKPYRCTSV
jgi:DNA-binding CsgD family transcriptional regulator